MLLRIHRGCLCRTAPCCTGNQSQSSPCWRRPWQVSFLDSYDVAGGRPQPSWFQVVWQRTHPKPVAAFAQDLVPASFRLPLILNKLPFSPNEQ